MWLDLDKSCRRPLSPPSVGWGIPDPVAKIAKHAFKLLLAALTRAEQDATRARSGDGDQGALDSAESGDVGVVQERE
jgi:hypothetical protein